MNFKVLEKEVKLEDLGKADEIWVSSSTKEIQPIHQVDNMVLPNKEIDEYFWYKALKILEEDLKGNC